MYYVMQTHAVIKEEAVEEEEEDLPALSPSFFCELLKLLQRLRVGRKEPRRRNNPV